MDRQRLAWALVAGLAVSLAASLDTASAAVDPIRVLILTGANNHDWAATTPVLRKLLDDHPRFAVVDVINDPSACDQATFARCDVVVSNWSAYPAVTGHQWKDTSEKAFVEFVRAGKGFVVFHAASATCQDWPEFQQLVGLTFGVGQTAHSAYHTFKVTIGDHNHPITRGLKDFWTTDELWHNMANLSGSPLHVLATTFSAADFGGTGKFEPVLVPTQLGQGRGLNIVLGHDVRAMRNSGWQTLLLRGTEWAATGSVTIPVPTNWPNCAAAAAVVGLDLDAVLKAVAGYRFGAEREALAQLEQFVMFSTSEAARGAAPGASDELAAKIAGALASAEATLEAKGFLCRQLALVGTPQQVPLLASLLNDESLADAARGALERIPGPAAAQALREAPGKASGRPTSQPAPASAASETPVLAPAWSWRQTEQSVALVNHDRVVWQLNHAKGGGKPCFHPLSLADGTELTWLSPPDHPWHRGLWFAWKDINGVSYWEEEKTTGLSPGRTDVQDVSVSPASDFSSRIEMTITYHPPDRPPVLTEKRILRVSPPDRSGGYCIDWRSDFTAGPVDLVLKGGTAGGGYGGLSLRIARGTSQWRIVDSEGREDVPAPGQTLAKHTHGQKARWVDFSLVCAGTHQPAGVAILDHPGNLRHPSAWHCIIEEGIPFGYINPAPLWSEPYTLGAGKVLSLRYRIVVHPGRADRDQLNGHWQALSSVKD